MWESAEKVWVKEQIQKFALLDKPDNDLEKRISRKKFLN